MIKDPLIRALYLEDREAEFRRFKPILENAFSFGRFPCQVIWAPDTKSFDAKLVDRPHIAVCDLDLGTGSPKSEGARVIARVKKLHPDVIFLVLTGQNLRIGQISAITPHADHFLNKEYLGNAEYDQYLAQFVRQNLRRYPVREIECSFDLKVTAPVNGRGTKLSIAELNSLVEQCLYGVDSENEGIEVGRVELTAVPGGFSGSAVYLMHIWTGDRRNSVPGILKVSEISHAREEIANYNRFVKWRLPYLWRVDVMGYGVCGNFGAICYSFAMGGGREPAPINKFLQAGQLHAVDAVVDNIFFSKNQNWYAERKQSGKDARIYFGEKPFYSKNSRRENREEAFREKLEAVCRIAKSESHFDETTFNVFGRKYPYINRCIFGRDWGEVTTCVCHGDMNGGNVIYTGQGGEVAFIDFQNTGFHYLFRDFISFESSLRLEIPGSDQRLSDGQFIEVLSEEERLAALKWTALPTDGSYVNEVSKVRHAANQNFPDQPFSHYVLANTIHSLWLLERSDKWEAYKRRRLLASILAGLSTLSTTDE